jgi:hypothetical protein
MQRSRFMNVSSNAGIFDAEASCLQGLGQNSTMASDFLPLTP